MSHAPAAPWVEDPEIVRRAHELFDRYDLSSARSPEAMMDRVIAIGGKPISVQKIDDPAITHTTALWVEYEDRSKIILRANDRPYYQVRGLHHEFAHILFQHPACTGLAAEPSLIRYTEGGVVRGRVLISDDDVSSAHGNRQQEGEAEYLGALITRTLLRPIYFDDERIFG